MKIKVGGRYVNRIGHIVTITKDDWTKNWPFRCDHGYTYTQKGRYVWDHAESALDLIHEFKDEGAQPKSSPLWWLVGIPLVMGLTWLSFNFEKIVLLIEKFN